MATPRPTPTAKHTAAPSPHAQATTTASAGQPQSTPVTWPWIPVAVLTVLGIIALASYRRFRHLPGVFVAAATVLITAIAVASAAAFGLPPWALIVLGSAGAVIVVFLILQIHTDRERQRKADCITEDIQTSLNSVRDNIGVLQGDTQSLKGDVANLMGPIRSGLPVRIDEIEKVLLPKVTAIKVAEEYDGSDIFQWNSRLAKLQRNLVVEFFNSRRKIESILRDFKACQVSVPPEIWEIMDKAPEQKVDQIAHLIRYLRITASEL